MKKRTAPIAARATTSPDLATARLPAPIAAGFAARGWAPRRHQLEMLAAARAGRSALLVAPTGAGKTMAGFLASLIELAFDKLRVIGMKACTRSTFRRGRRSASS